ncbi:MAG: glycosyltransferase [Myxacorys chilensis ATA2-1-KO14]|jgi:glycosyltransferase involved in cell wall biosynthesis|nr:glycosyltransferase [Myxacorys chilensis ATA2-1-KO14]
MTTLNSHSTKPNLLNEAPRSENLRTTLLVFDLLSQGHHAAYIRHLVEYWCSTQCPDSLTCVVTPEFLEFHPDLINFASEHGQPNVQFFPISEEDFIHLKAQVSFTAKVFTEWNLFCRYAGELNASQALLMYFDHLQLPILFGRKAPCPVSGIYFRPTFHYTTFFGYRSTWKDLIRRWRQKVLLALVLQRSNLKCLFSLDPFAVSHIAKFTSKTQVLCLPDPITPEKINSGQAIKLKETLKIDNARQIFLMFGMLSGRKGIFQVLDAIQQLDPDSCQKICLLLVGSIQPSQKSKIQSLILEVSQSRPIQIVVQDDFVPESDVALYYHIADVVLATYQRHVGMSGILLAAAAAQKPVISSDFGLMGELVKRYCLGLAIDSTNPSAIAQAILEALDGVNESCDRQKMEQFVNQNLAENFVKTLVKTLTGQLPNQAHI